MQFRTQIPISKSDYPIGYESKVVSLGSCFAVNLAEKLEYFKFQNTVNPFGILFHPLALEKFIEFAIDGKKIEEKDIFFHNERWHSFDAHSDASHPDKNFLLENLNAIIQDTNQRLIESTHVIITLGTAWVYKNFASDSIVANCHKVPQKEFAKALLSVETIVKSLTNIVLHLKNANPKASIIFTVSPVRHLKDGFAENQWSKSNLIAALHQVVNQTSSIVNYFPSYEIMMDELRDYRFYASDMLHPNQTAIDYIWERFVETWLSNIASADMSEIDNIQKSLQHRPFNPESSQHQDFLQNLQNRISKLQQKHSHITF